MTLHLRFFITSLTAKIGFDKPVDEISDFDMRLRIILRKHVAFLGWWSLLNLLGGVYGMVAGKGFWYYFFMMNMVWGLINFVVTMLVFNHAFFKKFKDGDSFARFEVQRHLEKMMLLNIGIDVAYVFAGLWLRSTACCYPVGNPELWQGFGYAVVLQGVVLLGNDLLFTRWHKRNFAIARPYLRSLIHNAEAQALLDERER